MIAIQHWNAIYSHNNCEKKVVKMLARKGIKHYCPVTQSVNHNQDKLSPVPVFPNIIFVQVSVQQDLRGLAALPNVKNLVYRLQEPATFPAGEIEQLKTFLSVHETVQTKKTGLNLAEADVVLNNNNAYTLSSEKLYTVSLPSLGYVLTAKADPVVTNIKLLRKNGSRYRTANSLALILGLKNSSSW